MDYFKKVYKGRVEALNTILRRNIDTRVLSKNQYDSMVAQNTRGMSDDNKAKESLRLANIEYGLGYAVPENVRVQKSVIGYGTNRTGYMAPVTPVPVQQTAVTSKPVSNSKYNFLVEIAKRQNEVKYKGEDLLIVDTYDNKFRIINIKEASDIGNKSNTNIEAALFNIDKRIEQIVIDGRYIYMYMPYLEEDILKIEKLDKQLKESESLAPVDRGYGEEARSRRLVALQEKNNKLLGELKTSGGPISVEARQELTKNEEEIKELEGGEKKPEIEELETKIVDQTPIKFNDPALYTPTSYAQLKSVEYRDIISQYVKKIIIKLNKKDKIKGEITKDSMIKNNMSHLVITALRTPSTNKNNVTPKKLKFIRDSLTAITVTSEDELNKLLKTSRTAFTYLMSLMITREDVPDWNYMETIDPKTGKKNLKDIFFLKAVKQAEDILLNYLKAYYQEFDKDLNK